MFCSTIIPTVGRATLTRAVESALSQPLSDEEHEVIIVNDSGKPLAVSSWQSSSKVKIIHTTQHERSVARNTGAATASGQFLHFLDDDDWLRENALGLFKEFANSSKAAWLYGATQLVDRSGAQLIQLRHDLKPNCFTQVMAGEWIPLQSSLIANDVFHQCGGFNAKIAGPEDIDLLRRIAIRWKVEGTDQLIACVSMGEQDSTTDYEHHSQSSRWAREQILDMPGAFTRMRGSAHTSFWKGRMVRAYLTSMVWNIQHGRMFKTFSRALYGALAMVQAGRHLASPDFWKALTGPYASETFQRGANEAKMQKMRGSQLKPL